MPNSTDKTIQISPLVDENSVGLDNHADERLSAFPSSLPSSASLEKLVDTAREYVKQAKSENTNTAYAKDWKDFNSWCRRRGTELFPPSPELVGLYITDCAAPDARSGRKPLSVASIERRLSGLSWHYKQQGTPLDRSDRHIATVLSGIKRKHDSPPLQKEAVLVEDIIAMIATLDHSLRGLRDRAILLLGFAGGLRRSEIVGLDVSRDDTEDGSGWMEIVDNPRSGGGAVLTIRGKTGWREVVVGRASSEDRCPVVALEKWLHFAKIAHGPVFRRILRDNKNVGAERLSDKHIARLVKKTVPDAGIRADLPEAERLQLFSGHSLRAGLASSANVEERHIQKQLGHASVEMTRRYQRRRDRFEVNLTKASGL
ncbi:MAG: tyrosine-type recombinase/integrase [Oleispira sp.]|nr:tyrosine-type recombinase/integrase [Oleispira sp.]